MTLHEKKLPFDSVIINITKGEQYSPTFLKVNPRGEVPVLQDSGKVIPDSARIIDYLEDNFTNGNHNFKPITITAALHPRMGYGLFPSDCGFSSFAPSPQCFPSNPFLRSLATSSSVSLWVASTEAPVIIFETIYFLNLTLKP